jgi:galactose mutarotase-like enzyme
VSRVYRAGLVVVVVSLAGCGPARLKEDRSFTLPDAGTGDRDKVFQLKAQKSEQMIKVEVTATEPVDVYVILTKDAENPADLSEADREKKATASRKGVTGETVTAKVPANQASQVLIALGGKSKKADVTVKMTN